MRDYLQLAQEYGTPVTIDVRVESEVSRDDYGAIKSRALSGAQSVLTWALPVERSPDERRLEKLGIREACDVAVQVPAMSLYPVVDPTDQDALGETWAALDLNRMTVRLDGQQFKVADKGVSVRYGDRPVAFSLALRRN
jgi:hypothetical protein